MTIKDFLGKGWRFPVDMNRQGGISISQHEESIRESIFIILGTAPGERLMRPYFGCEIHDLVFAPNNQNTATLAARYVEEALQKWEPRVDKVKANARTDRDEPNKLLVNIEYTVAANSVRRNLVYPFYLRKNEEQG